MISCREICKLYFWCNDITLFSPYDFYNALKSIFATDVVGCLCQLEVSNFGFAPGPKITGRHQGREPIPPTAADCPIVPADDDLVGLGVARRIGRVW